MLATVIAYALVYVAPLAGAWIEITLLKHFEGAHIVAPLAGAWIEISFVGVNLSNEILVAPLAGAWIEMRKAHTIHVLYTRRSPRGSVD